MAASALGMKAVHCPHCNQPLDENSNLVSEDDKGPVHRTEILCPHCQKTFTHYAPARASLPAGTAHPVARPAGQGSKAGGYGWVGAIAFVVFADQIAKLSMLNGPHFLVFFGAVFFLSYLPTIGNDAGTKMLGLCAFELVGLLRILHGGAAGMHKFGYLGMMMAIGAILFFVEWDSPTGSYSPRFGWWGSCGGYYGHCSSYYHHCSGGWGGWWGGGGCGGGGGGGGGCGGCGG